MEMPYETTMSLDTYIDAWAARPNDIAYSWSIWRYENGTYNKNETTSNWSMVGRMIAGTDENYGVDNSIEIKAIGNQTDDLLKKKMADIKDNPQSINNRSGMNLFVADGEIMSYGSIDQLPNGNFVLKDVIRGVYDTVPRKHFATTYCYFFDTKRDVNKNRPVARAGMTSKESLEITSATTEKAQDFDKDKTTNILTARRSESPSIMGNLQFSADKGNKSVFKYNFPAGTVFTCGLKFKFNNRNKFSDFGIKSHLDNPVDIPNSTVGIVRVSCNGREFEMRYDLTNNGEFFSKWEEFCSKMRNRIMDSNQAHIEILTYDSAKALYSYDKYEKDIIINVPRIVGVVERVEDVQDYMDSIVRETNIFIPDTTVSKQQTMLFDDGALVLIGKKGGTTNLVKGQDGQMYDISGYVAYRLDGVDIDNSTHPPILHPIYHKIVMEEEFIFRNNFNNFGNNTTDYFRIRSGNVIKYDLYVKS